MTLEVQAHSERIGYPAGLCSYALCDLGYTLSGISPVGGLPEPDFFNQQFPVRNAYQVV